MPRSCRICGRRRPHEKFSGKGHATHVCKDCQRMPAEKRHHLEALDEISGYLEQSNLSEKNLSRLATLSQASNREVQELATLVLEIGKAHPRKRRRLKYLAKNRRDLYDQLLALGFIEEEPEFEETSDFADEFDDQPL